MRLPLLLAGWVGCAAEVVELPDDPPAHPCASDVDRLDVAPPNGEFGELVSGGTLWCGNPPQGGAPYSPFRLRILGDVAYGDGVFVEMTAADSADGSELAYTSLNLGVACANVGESAGMWVGSEAHMRYDGFALDALDGREAEVTIRATAVSDPDVTVAYTADVALTLTTDERR